jgi:GGDEF domain-containing protein
MPIEVPDYMAEPGKEPDSVNAAGKEERSPFLEAISMLLEGIAANAAMHPICDPGFPGKIRSLKTEIERAEQANDALRTAKSSVQAMEAHAAAVTKYMQGQRDALKAQLDQFTQSFGAATDRVVQDEQRKAGASDSAAELPPARPPTKGELDPVSGLPTAGRALAGLEAAIASKKQTYIALFAVERLDIVNSRFGFAVGDRMLLMFSQHIAQLLSTEDQLFRWRGPTLIALLKRDRPEKLVEAEVLRLAGSRLEYNVNTREHDVLLRITCSHSVLSLGPDSKISDIVERIDSFSVDRTIRTR